MLGNLVYLHVQPLLLTSEVVTTTAPVLPLSHLKIVRVFAKNPIFTKFTDLGLLLRITKNRRMFQLGQILIIENIKT